MTREYNYLREHAVEEKNKETPGRIVSHDVNGESSYYERANYFRKKLSKTIDPSMPIDQLVSTVVESALFSEFTENITKHKAYANMKEAITSALLHDQELTERISHLADKYRKPEHTH
jgi:ferritin